MSDIVKVAVAGAVGYMVGKQFVNSASNTTTDGDSGDSLINPNEREVYIVYGDPDDKVDPGTTFLMDDIDGDQIVTKISTDDTVGNLQYSIEQTLYEIFEDLLDDGELSSPDLQGIYLKYKDPIDLLVEEARRRQSLIDAVTAQSIDDQGQVETWFRNAGYDLSSSDDLDRMAKYIEQVEIEGVVDTNAAQDIVMKIMQDILKSGSLSGHTDAIYDPIIRKYNVDVSDIITKKQVMDHIDDDTYLGSFFADEENGSIKSHTYQELSGLSLVDQFDTILKYKTDRTSDVDAANNIIKKHSVPGCFSGYDVNAVILVGSYVSISVANYIFKNEITSADVVNARDVILYPDPTGPFAVVSSASFDYYYLYRLKRSGSVRRSYIGRVDKPTDKSFVGIRLTPHDAIGIEYAHGQYNTSYKKRSICGSKTVTVPHVAYVAFESEYEFAGVEVHVVNDASRVGIFEV